MTYPIGHRHFAENPNPAKEARIWTRIGVLQLARMTKISDALNRVHKTAKDHIVRSQDISRADREILVQGRWLQQIIKGWYLLVRPDAPPGESSPWYASFWDFLGLYLQDLYGNEYCLSAESSLDLLINPTTIPKQVIVMAAKGNNSPLELPFNTSLLTYADPHHIPEERVQIKGVQTMSLPLALCRVGPTYFVKNSKDAEIALQLVKDPSELIRLILRYDLKRAANRIIGAYLFLQQPSIATQIRTTLEQEFFYTSPENPFQEEKPSLLTPVTSSYTARIYMLWNICRDAIIQIFPIPNRFPDKKTYFAEMEKIYAQDAYNSLSIEGYRVNDELIEKVINNNWNPDQNATDQSTRDALAALGYYKAFQSVKKSIGHIFDGTSPHLEAKENLHQWMRNLFQPMIDAQILSSQDLIGYRRNQVYIRGSRHIPFPREAILDAMDAFYHCLANESHAAVRAVLGHFIFVYIHPYMDGNGRTARFLMNVMFASGGYPWTVIQLKNRDRYFAALESASIDHDIAPLAHFIKEEMNLRKIL